MSFLFRQNLWRKIQSLGLSKQYEKKNTVVSQFLKKIFGLSLLPSAEVCYCYALEFVSNLPNDKRLEQFWDYLLEYILMQTPLFLRLFGPNVLHHY
jgi:hypothetical protein